MVRFGAQDDLEAFVQHGEDALDVLHDQEKGRADVEVERLQHDEFVLGDLLVLLFVLQPRNVLVQLFEQGLVLLVVLESAEDLLLFEGDQNARAQDGPAVVLFDEAFLDERLEQNPGDGQTVDFHVPLIAHFGNVVGRVRLRLAFVFFLLDDVNLLLKLIQNRRFLEEILNHILFEPPYFGKGNGLANHGELKSELPIELVGHQVCVDVGQHRHPVRLKLNDVHVLALADQSIVEIERCLGKPGLLLHFLQVDLLLLIVFV